MLGAMGRLLLLFVAVPALELALLIEIGSRAPDAAAPWFLALKAAIPAGLFLYYARGGYLPELRASRWTAGGTALDVVEIQPPHLDRAL